MSYCTCQDSTHYTATGEGGGEHLYVRCNECGGKVGKVHNRRDLVETLPNPDKRGDKVTLTFRTGDNPWIWEGEQ